MPLELQPMVPSDALSWTRIRSLAYRGPTHDLLHNGPISEASMRGVAQDRVKEIGKPNAWHWKVIDTNTPPTEDDGNANGGRTIAIAVWSAHNIEKEKQASSEPTVSPAATEPKMQAFLPSELRLEPLAALFGPLRKAQQEINGDRPYLMLNTLATHPEHQGRGAAKLLLDWGLEKADEEGLVTYLDSSEVARRMYEARDFALVREVKFDRSEWGGAGMDWYGCMIRNPRPIVSE